MKNKSVMGIVLLLVLQVVSFVLLPFICFKLMGVFYLMAIIGAIVTIVMVTSEDADSILKVVKRILGAILIVVSSFLIMWFLVSYTACKLIFS